LWLADALIRQRKAADALELRLGGVRQGVKGLVISQIDADAAAHHLARTDPEQALGAVAERLTEAERLAQVQAGRNEIGDLQTRVDALRSQQQGLRERLLPALEKRRLIEQLFAELDSREQDIDHALAEIASGDDATAIEVRLANLADFIRQGHARCDEVETASQTLTGLKQDYTELRGRLAPYTAADDGVTRRIRELSEARDRLSADIDALLQTPKGSLATRVQSFADDKRKLDEGVANLETEFSKLATLRKDVAGLATGFDRALTVLAVSDESAGDSEARVAEVAGFIKATQAAFDEIERTTLRFADLRTQLGGLQTRLAPLEAKDGGVADLAAQVKDIRDRLMAKIAHIEAGEDGNLAARVKTLTEQKQELEKRVSTVTEHYSKLATIRSDITGLFDKLSSAADASST
jgi:chromosome segregation ATPase